MDEFDVVDEETAKTRLRERSAVVSLEQLATERASLNYSHVPLTGSVVAGTGLETVQAGTCGALACRRPSLDADLGSLLHYFDYVVMQGPSARDYTDLSEAIKNPDERPVAIHMAVREMECLLYLRSTGISNHIIFANKPSCFCDHHFKDHAAALGLAEMADRERIAKMAKRLSRAGLVRVEQRQPRDWYGYISEPLFFGSIGKRYRRKTAPKKAAVAEEILRRDLMAVVFDAAAAQMMGLPMASMAVPQYFDRDSESSRPRLTVDEVATQLKVPILSSLTTKQIVELRERESAHFEAFRAALREAVATTLEKIPAASPQLIGELAWQEQLKPALADLERRISASRSSLWQSSSSGLVLGVAATTVASVVTAPWAAAMLGAAVATTLPVNQISEYFKERKQVNVSPMYFLWKAKKAQNHA
ncbi:hypothetical protein [Micromonospora sp. 067-2]|uniref:hypothetical protein n=1 Tax=Micromonospora sp. 067-2 TaxID=2789270 RepID=UPI00397E3C0E